MRSHRVDVRPEAARKPEIAQCFDSRTFALRDTHWRRLFVGGSLHLSRPQCCKRTQGQDRLKEVSGRERETKRARERERERRERKRERERRHHMNDPKPSRDDSPILTICANRMERRGQGDFSGCLKPSFHRGDDQKPGRSRTHLAQSLCALHQAARHTLG